MEISSFANSILFQAINDAKEAPVTRREVLTIHENESSIMNPPTQNEIAIRAHEIFLARGTAQGNDLEDWLQAELELTLKPTNGAPATVPLLDSRKKS